MTAKVRTVEAVDEFGSTYAFECQPPATTRFAGRHLAWLIAIGMVPHPVEVVLTRVTP